jgi:RHS repeat-associated protein
MTGYDSKYTGPSWQQIMAGGLDGGDIQHPIGATVTMNIIMTRDYCGNYTYRNGVLERIMIGSGFMQDGAYYVQVKDYQGNVRAVLDQNHNVVERNEYYPYGGLINASDTQLQPYKYSSKELDRENGLDWYDNNARWYDPIFMRFTTPDPLQEKYPHLSPYAYCANNPFMLVDPSGKIIEDPDGLYAFYKPIVMDMYYESINNYKSMPINSKDFQQQISYVTMLGKLIDGYNELEKSDQIYRITLNGLCENPYGENEYSLSNNTININIHFPYNSSDGRGLMIIAQELEHAVQFEFGKISYNTINGGAGFLYDLLDEIESYRVGEIIYYGKDFFKPKFSKKISINAIKTEYQDVINKAQQIKDNNIFRIVYPNEKRKTIYN